MDSKKYIMLSTAHADIMRYLIFPGWQYRAEYLVEFFTFNFQE